MQHIPAFGKTSRGIDVSHYEPTINWSQVRKTLEDPADPGDAFAVLKASEGLTALDRTYSGFAAGCEAAGLKHAAYHFFHPSLDPVQQARFFLRVAGLNAHRYVLDLETMDNDPANHVVASVQAFLNEVEATTKKVPMVYGSPYFLEALGLPGSFARYPLWVADYAANPAPRVPAPWKGWVIRQTSESGTVAGVVGAGCDLDLFNGNASVVSAFFAA